ncbi:FimV/HubP family polar landmark protein [Xanthomonas rydalmerensis]|uniref:FimV/HubP family polar landmark protein n=1 Tax=Xanthomonas rydalmerensis TaxID=3046274 RepID=A0ABZ0JKJ7_9XANT|nr:FimV/HubP family polar landmark protein [Xanthomonas sp. DM-2023]WOS39555.1 FimV/HubP family polar landmark protein [Xanthomonas sp. DM-2023]WOS43739.1 FimV/HubP family polar landmark protein [Xanthomonas sp. DM-2023]WOS47920.1 FimV/HubP family polar landmark protein [Xanthomonas sp. DM-2023]WOS52098.1 FimV/HubP family polar landmark protein [Xanthomonas sp. DM-2023]
MRLQPRLFRRRSGDAVPAARGLRHVSRAAAALLLLACSQAALALGLGDIRVLSKPGEPFLAEIPVISNEPGELERARVALASPATFARVGLERPQGLVSDLQFRFTQTRKGRAVIQVSSRMPVEVPSLSFLIEVDWGQGRLIREYSALIDAPNTAAAIDAPAIDAPAAAQPSDRIARDASTAAPAPAGAATSATPNARPAAAPRPAPAPAAVPGDALAPVRAGQTLSQIAGQLARGNGHSLDQTMVALLRANPDAFIRGNLNLLKQGAVLRTPREEDLASLDAAAAEAVVREQAAQWRQARAPVPQPAQAQQDTATAQAAAKPAAAAPAAAAAGARLEIAPAVPATRREAGTKSGTGAGDEGDMVAAQQLQQAREDLAARDAEVQELRSRVEQLEKLKSQQQQLIALKDSDLAAAQKRLAQSGQAAPAAAAPAPANAGFPLWLWGGVSLLVLGIGAWLLSRRRKPSPLPPLPRDDDAALAAGATVPVVAHRDVDAPELPPLEPAEPLAEDATAARDEEALAEWERPDHADHAADDHADHADHHVALDDDAFERVLAQQSVRHAPADAPLSAGNDEVHSIDTADARPEPAPAAESAAEAAWPQPSPLSAVPNVDAHVDTDAGAGRQEPTWHQPVVPAPAPAAPAAAEASSPYPPAGRERLELAVAYMDLGDNETARTLLTEVAASGDPAARAEALQLLGRLD